MMYIIKIPEGMLFTDMPEALQSAIAKQGGIHADTKLVNTTAYNGFELQLIAVNLDIQTLEYLTNNDLFDEDGFQYGYDLGWQVVASENTQIDQDLLLPYFKDELTFDEDGEVNGSQPVTDLTGKIQTWAGRQWVY